MARADTPESTDAYINSCPESVRGILQQVREIISDSAPDGEETISYGIPTFRLHGKNLVHFAAHTGHIGFYPTPSAITAFEEKLARYKTSKGAVQFPLDEPMPTGLIREMTAFRVEEVTGRRKC